MKEQTTDALPFDIRELSRSGLLVPLSQFEWIWRKTGDRGEHGVKVRVLEDALEVRALRASETPQRIELAYSTGNQGGRRTWLLCPYCKQKAAILYYRPDRPDLPLTCRRCAGLVYASQYPTRDRTYGRRHRCFTERSLARAREREAAQREAQNDPMDVLGVALMRDVKRLL